MKTQEIITWLRDKLPYAPDHGWKNKMQEAITMLSLLEKKLEFAEAERDVVTKRMVELEQAAATPVSKAVTNADRIRAIVATDEGLADCLLVLDIALVEDGKEFTHLYCHGDNGCVDENEDITCNAEMRKACVLRWLQQPAEEAAEDGN